MLKVFFGWEMGINKKNKNSVSELNKRKHTVVDRPKMGSQNQKSGFAQSLKISIFSVPKLQENVQGSI